MRAPRTNGSRRSPPPARSAPSTASTTTPTADAVIDFLAFSSSNPSSIQSCLETARANGRAVRTALTMEMWEAINAGWLELKRYDGAKMDRPTLNEFLGRVKEACLRFDGVGLPDDAPQRRLFLLARSASISSAPTIRPASST